MVPALAEGRVQSRRSTKKRGDMWQGFVQYLRRFPLLGGLVDCGLKDHWDAASQIFVTLTLSTTPIWLATLLLYAMAERARGTRF